MTFSHDRSAAGLLPWVVVGPMGVSWLGHASDEADAWRVALGWPSQEEIDECKRLGWYASQATVTWPSPRDGLGVSPEIERARADRMYAADRAVLLSALKVTQEALDRLITDITGARGVDRAIAQARSHLPSGFRNAYRGQADALQPRQRRVFAEHLVLEARLEGLRQFLASPQFEAADQKDLLLQQATHMERYAMVLRRRLEAWGISLQPGPDGAPALREEIR
jgi:hypothetical protein